MNVTSENLRRINRYNHDESAIKSMAYRVALLHSLAESFRTFTLDSKHWITKNGEHMQIEAPGGKVVKGPPSLKGHNIRKAKRHKQGQKADPPPRKKPYFTDESEGIWLERQEYAHVMSELNTHATREQRNWGVFYKEIGKYGYLVKVDKSEGYDRFVIIDKMIID